MARERQAAAAAVGGATAHDAAHAKTAGGKGLCMVGGEECSAQSAGVYTYIRAYIHTYIHAYILTHTHTYMQTCIHAYIF